MAVVVAVVEEDLRVGDTVIGLDDGVVNLGNADEEDAISGADYERTLFAEGIGQAATWCEIVGLEGDFAGWREQGIRKESGG